MRRTGRAIIQVQETDGDNAIVLFPGENHAITQQDAAAIPWSHYSAILLQNEISHVDTFIRMASENGLRVFFKYVSSCMYFQLNFIRMPNHSSPAPCPKDIRQCVNLSQVHVLVVNESEFECIMESGSTTTTTTTTTNSTKHQLRMLCLMKEFQNLEILVVTLGEEGLLAVYRRGVGPDPKPSLSTSSTSSSYFLSETETSCIFLQLPAMQRIKVADTIGAGNFLKGNGGFFLSFTISPSKVTVSLDSSLRLSSTLLLLLLLGLIPPPYPLSPQIQLKWP